MLLVKLIWEEEEGKYIAVGFISNVSHEELDISPVQWMVPAATHKRDIQLLFSSSGRIETDEYNSFLRKAVGMEEAL